MTRLDVDHRLCTTRFRDVARAAGARLSSHPIAAIGPDGAELAIDVAVLGAERPDRTLVVLAGVHGVGRFPRCGRGRP